MALRSPIVAMLKPSDLFHRADHLFQGRSIPLIFSPVDVANRPFRIDHQRRWMGDLQGVHSKTVVQTIRLGRGSILIQQERKRDRVFLQELPGLEYPVAFLRRDEGKLCAQLSDLALDRLNLSHALGAVRSPRSPQELQDERSAL